jgi:ribokinase
MLGLVGRVAVLGSLNMDLVVQVQDLPAPGQTVVGDRLRTVPGGKGANQAVAAARLGGKVRMVGRVGSDAYGEELVEGLGEDGVDVSGIGRDGNVPTGVALILVAAGGQNMIALAPGANSRVSGDEVLRLADGLEPGDVVVLQLEVPLAAVAAAAQAARRIGALVVFNAAPGTPVAGRELPLSDLLVVNEGEAAEIGGRPVPDLDAAESAAQRLSASADAVVITMGRLGAVLWDAGSCSRVAPRHVDAVDATAAGDAFVGAVAGALAAGWSLTEAVHLGNAAGAAAATRFGARDSLPRPADLKRLFGLALEGSPE